jgi:outer membrane protein OmpA-like peptidoglycan-associated protein
MTPIYFDHCLVNDVVNKINKWGINMSLRSRRQEALEEFDIWPAFTDLMSNSFMILSFIVLLAMIKPLVSIESLRATEDQLRNENKQLQQQLENARKTVATNQQQIRVLNNEIAQLEASVTQQRQRAENAENQVLTFARERQELQTQLEEETKRPKAPPIIVIQDTGSYQFQSGSAALPDALGSYIRQQLVPQIESNAEQYNIDVVEIIGHTDGQVNQGGVSNLDRSLENVVNGNTSINQLSPGSNADLGLMRALAVVKILQEIQQKEKRLKGLEFRPYSAAQLVTPSGNLAEVNRNPDAKRRRIEIRFTRLGQVTNVE